MNYAVNDLLGVDQRATTGGANKTVGYHVVNVIIHLLNGLLLLGIIRRTIRSGRGLSAWADSANAIATVVTALWLLHPLQTDAVDYVIQRTKNFLVSIVLPRHAVRIDSCVASVDSTGDVRVVRDGHRRVPHRDVEQRSDGNRTDRGHALRSRL